MSSAGKVTIAKDFVGKATITITAGSEKYKTARATITVTVNPAKVALTGAANGKGRKLTVKWKRNAKVTGYQVQYSTDKSFKKSSKTVKIKKNTTLTTTVKSLKKGSTYYVRVRT